MFGRGTVSLAAVVLALLPPGGRAQTTVMSSAGGGTPYTLEGVGGGDPFTAVGLNGDPLLGGGNPPAVKAVLNTSVGFSYLRPLWSGAGLELRVPAGAGAAAFATGPTADLSRTFAFVPRVDLTYDTATVGVGGSFQYLGLGGSLDRTVTLSGGSASLLATNTLSVVSVGLPEVRNTVFFAADDHRPTAHWLGLTNATLVGTLGTRYTAIRQDYRASLVTGPAVATTDATQSFNGIGLTVGLDLDRPVGHHWGLYTNNRWTLLLGQNHRKSSSSGVDAAGPFSNSISENKTTLFPVGELEVGFRYLAAWTDPATRQAGGRQLFVRAGFVGQYYNGIAFLPAAGGDARFADRPLFLVGFTVTAGIEY